jgi:hypothetical protein
MTCERSALSLVVTSSSFSCRSYCLLLCLIAAGCHSRTLDLAHDPVGAGSDAGPGKRDSAVPMNADAAPDDAAISGADAAILPRTDAGPVARCGSAPCACDDGIDNDHDGLIDGLDPECTGAYDQDEATFATGNPSKIKNCRDCFWDEDQGTGNDACRYPSVCLQGVEPPGNGSCGSCQVAQKCVDTCAARTPNGCDCFGCCEVARPNGVTVRIELSDRCSLDKIDDTSACPRCTQSSQCRNPCGRCELCPGRTLQDLPADCRARNPPNQCDEGQPVCETSTDCTTDQYCQQGCCFGLLL